MSVKFGLWRVDNGAPVKVPTVGIPSEQQLENILEAELDILGLGRLLLVGRQVTTNYGKRIDLLAIDSTGVLYVLELKKDRTAREVVSQALEYGFWVQNLSLAQVAELFAVQHKGEDFDSAFSKFFDTEALEELNSSHNLIVVATSMDASTEQIIDYVRGFRVPINVLFFDYLKDDDRAYLARSWRSDPDAEAPTSPAAKKQSPWNGRDYYFAAGGQPEWRDWEDMRRYGFISAGHALKSQKAVQGLPLGSRVWAMVPKSGYVGVGEVTAEAVPINDFTVQRGGEDCALLSVPLVASAMEEGANDPQQTEYVARVRWLDSRPKTEAFWENGMFANPNIVTKLRDPFTMQRLMQEFPATGSE
jgi:hypothetical protein